MNETTSEVMTSIKSKKHACEKYINKMNSESATSKSSITNLRT